ncbi:MAG: hypothetical protein CBE07_001215 [Pelagibacteraceae bacterium TMED247]|jgi:hypothetical protein|nr:MAG: hypothetical protein CBE07_001215 [Pelagibacteraceae bacterium TMED247]|tara:strand:+ start:6280 stop:6549 length:270 start_codon:yes stop_codon:yes gene_type:complete
MVEVKHDNRTYRYCRNSEYEVGYWIGIEGKRNNMFNGPHCKIPMMYYRVLQNEALRLGYSITEFIPKSKPEKIKKIRAKKKAKGSISIF